MSIFKGKDREHNDKKLTWFGAENFCRKRGWLFGELQSQNAQRELAEGQLGFLSEHINCDQFSQTPWSNLQSTLICGWRLIRLQEKAQGSAHRRRGNTTSNPRQKRTNNAFSFQGKSRSIGSDNYENAFHIYTKIKIL